MNKNNLRRGYLVYPKFQVPLILVNVSINWAILCIFGYHLLRSFRSLREMGVEANLPVGHPYFKFVDYHAFTLYSNLQYGLILGAIGSICLTLFLSHRLAGPIVRLKSYLETVKETGKITRLQFRKSDFFSDLAPLVNETLENVKDRDLKKVNHE